MNFQKIFDGQITLLQIFFQFVINSEIIIKTSISPDDSSQENIQAGLG